MSNDALRELAACPFCGSTDVRVFGDKPEESMIGGFNVICGNPNCQATCRHSGDRDKAITAWNRRADAAIARAEQAERDALRWRTYERELPKSAETVRQFIDSRIDAALHESGLSDAGGQENG